MFREPLWGWGGGLNVSPDYECCLLSFCTKGFVIEKYALPGPSPPRFRNNMGLYFTDPKQERCPGSRKAKALKKWLLLNGGKPRDAFLIK